ncbi:hypothetical protein D3C86_1277540 [compost metagenome]
MVVEEGAHGLAHDLLDDRLDLFGVVGQIRRAVALPEHAHDVVERLHVVGDGANLEVERKTRERALEVVVDGPVPAVVPEVPGDEARLLEVGELAARRPFQVDQVVGDAAQVLGAGR